ncbi:MAG: hypothetical protein AVDCRST_MAG73-989 [uncultured Thermomicrobiales bacterium]|uniref:Uncharacterized protein n=1 Tax=uncultured Thermomicrobiales bacterium TaxID=1645740 RepID=A0A6J4TT23_9BACT|nr:MAG: hypothetical protein AVDCRST_MAG73-989 [uncultured Thermomicrobiales bacterium]
MGASKHEQPGGENESRRSPSGDLIHAGEPKSRRDPGSPEVTGHAAPDDAATEDGTEVEGHFMGVHGLAYADAKRDELMREADKARRGDEAKKGKTVDRIRERFAERDKG